MGALRSRLWHPLSGPVFLMLAACTPLATDVAPSAEPVVVPPPEPEIPEKIDQPVTPAVAPKPKPRPHPDAEDRREAQAARDKADFDSLIGQDFEAVAQRLGAADQVIDLNPGKGWQYSAGACRLVVRFYPDMKTLAYRALSYDIGLAEEASAAKPGPMKSGEAKSGEAKAGQKDMTTLPATDARLAQCRTRLAARLKSER